MKKNKKIKTNKMKNKSIIKIKNKKRTTIKKSGIKINYMIKSKKKKSRIKILKN